MTLQGPWYRPDIPLHNDTAVLTCHLTEGCSVSGPALKLGVICVMGNMSTALDGFSCHYDESMRITCVLAACWTKCVKVCNWVFRH